MANKICGGSRGDSKGVGKNAGKSAGKNVDKNDNSGIDTKVVAASGKPSIGKRPTQGISGKLDNGTSAMSGAEAAAKGGPIKTIASQPISGKNGNGTSAMGDGDIIKGVI